MNLSELVSDSTRFLGVIILGAFTYEFLSMSVSLYRIYIFLKFNDVWQLYDFLDFISLITWIGIKITILYLLCAESEAISTEVIKPEF